MKYFLFFILIFLSCSSTGMILMIDKSDLSQAEKVYGKSHIKIVDSSDYKYKVEIK